MAKNYYRVWYTKNNVRKYVVVEASTGKEAKAEVKKQIGGAKVGTVWKINI